MSAEIGVGGNGAFSVPHLPHMDLELIPYSSEVRANCGRDFASETELVLRWLPAQQSSRRSYGIKGLTAF